MKTNDFFNKTKRPNDSFELFRWIFFESFLLKDFEEELSNIEIIIWYVKTFIWITLFAVFFYIIINLFLSSLQIPYYMSIYFNIEIIDNLNNISNFNERFYYLISYSYEKFVIWSLCGSFFGGIIWAIIGNLTWSLIISLSISIILGITKAYFNDIIIASVIWSFVLGFTMGLAIDIKSALFIGFFSFASGFFIEGFDVAVNIFLGFEIGFILSFFGILFYPFHQIKTLFFSISLIDNPYVIDSKIYLPIFNLKNKLKNEAFKKPLIAEKFKFFLLKFRPLQVDFANELTNVINASLMFYNPLDDNNIKITNTKIDNDEMQYWIDSLIIIKNEIVKFKNQSNINNQIANLYHITLLYKDILNATKNLNKDWKDYYIKAINENIKSSKILLESLKLQKDELYYKNEII